jgi:hypothetical protein
MKCQEIQERGTLYLYDELVPVERAEFEAHIAACEACRGQLERLKRFESTLEACPRPEPSPEFVAHCRLSLDEALDREQLGWRALARSWFWNLSPAPASRAAAVATLVIFGFGLGWMLRPRVGSLPTLTPAGQASSFDLNNYRVRNISQIAQDPQSGGVRITLDAERRVTLEGSLDDPRIREVLVNTMKNYDNPGIRRDTLDVLRADPEEPSIRAALMQALHDANPGVRLEALKTVNHMECGVETHGELLKVVEKDPNAGVRTAAIDALVEHVQAEGPDAEVTTGFEKVATSDPDAAVRMRCMAALRKCSE